MYLWDMCVCVCGWQDHVSNLFEKCLRELLRLCYQTRIRYGKTHASTHTDPPCRAHVTLLLGGPCRCVRGVRPRFPAALCSADIAKPKWRDFRTWDTHTHRHTHRVRVCLLVAALNGAHTHTYQKLYSNIKHVRVFEYDMIAGTRARLRFWPPSKFAPSRAHNLRSHMMLSRTQKR